MNAETQQVVDMAATLRKQGVHRKADEILRELIDGMAHKCRDLYRSDLQGANLTGAKGLSPYMLKGAILTGANLQDADLQDATGL